MAPECQSKGLVTYGGGGPQVGEITSLSIRPPNLSCKRDQIIMRDYVNRGLTPPKWVTSPTWGPPPSCKQALKRPYVPESSYPQSIRPDTVDRYISVVSQAFPQYTV